MSPRPSICGAGAPGEEVEKKTGWMSAKSPSARMRSMRTEPTIPRHPTKPTAGAEL